MLTGVIEWSLANRALVIALFVLMALGGLYAATQIPVDAVPDLVNVQVQVVTEAGTLPPLEVERLITYPVELAMSGLPDVEELRSISRLGISLVTIVFREHTDIMRARQLVAERLPAARGGISLPDADPQLGTLSTALGEILQFELRGPQRSLMDLRSILEWDVAPVMRTVPGVTDINSHGGYAKSYEVQVDPDRMSSHGISLDEVLAALDRNNTSTGGGYVVKNGEQRFIRGESLLRSIDDIERVVVRSPAGGVPILIRDIGSVRIGALTRQGAATRDGRGEAVTGMVMMVRGENSRRVVTAAKEKLEVVRRALPSDVQLEILYDRSDLIARTLDTVLHNLAEGGLLVIAVLLVLLGNVRAGLIVSLAIPLSMLFAANLMWAVGIPASLMSLGAIDFGLVVDSSVIMVENCVRRLGLAPPTTSKLEIVRDAAVEVRGPTMFGELIIAIVYLPILFLEGTEGKLFRPMALTVLFALLGSLVISLTLMPVLAATVLSREEEHEPLIMRIFHRLYQPLARFAVYHPVVISLVAAGLVAASVPVALKLGAEFMPRLDEGDLLVEVNRLPSATLEDSIPLTTRIEEVLGGFPEVKTVFCKTGRPEIANDIMGVQQTDVWVMLKPHSTWPEGVTRDHLVTRMSEALTAAVPGANFGFSQPIEMRVDELVAGVKADVAVLVYGDDLDTLGSLGKKIEGVLRDIPGAADVRADWQANVPTLRIDARQDQLARHGVNGLDVMQTVSAMGGIQTGVIYEGRPRFPLMVKFPQAWREDEDLVPQIPVAAAGSRPVPLGELADIRIEESPPSIEHENSRRRTFVSANVRGRDVASFVAEAQRRIAAEVKLPSGYTLEWGGDFENLLSASRRLLLITPVVLGLIALLLYTSFKSLRLAALIFCAVPVAASGGIAALALREMPFSIAAGVGFVALFGVAVLNGLVWVAGAEHAREGGLAAREAAIVTAEVRIRPVLMTALVASLGFLPMAMATSSGAEIQRPLATVVIGGIITSTLLTAFVIPAIYPWFAPRPRPASTSG
ncbi:MAG: CusA/CzcA family heavy metal efflux RND transporter [Planctomycetes bacterium]|nr:CusA/CzcA family heavy metal efflux RND transporter [Planctomycetota bacterium]